MSNAQKEKWSEVLEYIKPEINSISFETWFKPIEFKRIDEKQGKLYIQVYKDMNKDALEKRYNHLLSEAVENVYGREYTIVIRITQEKTLVKTDEAYEEIEKPFKEEYYLNPKYNFGSFVVADNNKYAHAAAVAVAEAPAQAYNPLFIYGGSGLGKTHLMHAIGHYILQNHKNLNVLYVSSEMFTNEYIKALKEKKIEEFKNKYRKIDVLLIDDIQFLEGKIETQKEFFHTFNELHDSNKQIVISSDRPANKLTELDDRLRSRLQWNIVVDISAPDYETRVAILEKKADLENIEVDKDLMEAIQLVAEKIKTNIRELEGAFSRIIAFSALMNQKKDLRLAKIVLKDILSNSDFNINAEFIKKEVCKYYNIKPADIESAKRTRNLAYPRQIAMYLCREMTDYSLPKIGEAFGGRDHTTVLHAYEKISKEILTDDNLKKAVIEIQNRLEEKK
ncbi:MAG: chromosomal replication initiator protein DnaA [Clostridia bacterium]|nr:chromosomal replication initiator protein DnaA [Clostridia bacterium]